MTIAAFMPPQFLKSHDEATLWNALMTWTDAPVPLAPPRSSATVTVAEAPAPDAAGLVLAPQSGPRLLLVPEAFPFKAMFGLDIDIQDMLHLPPPLREALSRGVVNLIWSALPDNRMGAARITASGPMADLAGAAGGADLKWLAVQMDGIAPEPVRLRLGLDIGAALAVIGSGQLAARAFVGALAARLTTEAAYTLGALTLPLAELRSLAPGDLVVLQALADTIALVRVDGATHAFERGDAGWTHLGHDDSARYRAVPDQKTGAGDMTDAVGETGLAGMPVVVDFDLGRVSVALGEVQAWTQGTLVGLNPPVAAAGVEVTIRVNGQAIGSGDLVQVDDRLAVRITQIAAGG